MGKLLFTSVSITCLLGVSAVVYANWTLDPEKYKGDCMETLCPHGCAESDSGEAVCCPEPVEGEDCQKDEYDEKGCKVKTIKTCAEDEICDTLTSTCKTCPTDIKTSCTITQDITDKNNCVLVKKINCEETEDTPNCDKKTGQCIKCPETTKTSCAIAQDVTNASGCITTKKINCEETEDTPICDKKTGQCVSCELNTDCAGLQYCNASNHQCNACPTNLPKSGQKCTDTCGCANGLTCVIQGTVLCGFTGICQSVCESNSDCGKGEYCAFENYTGQCDKGVGECKSNKNVGSSFSSKDFGNFHSSGETMTWWSAENWCASHGWNLTGVYDSLSCYYGSSYVDNLGGNDAAHCCKYGKEDCWDKTANMSDKMLKLRKVLGKKGCYWTDHYSSCHAYTLGLEANQIWNTPLTGKYTIRSPKNYMHALCQ